VSRTHDIEKINERVDRMAVPGGWLYVAASPNGIASTFVPDPQAEHVRGSEAEQPLAEVPIRFVWGRDSDGCCHLWPVDGPRSPKDSRVCVGTSHKWIASSPSQGGHKHFVSCGHADTIESAKAAALRALGIDPATVRDEVADG